jgi:hypothetical protein
MDTTNDYYYQCRAVDPPVGALGGPALLRIGSSLAAKRNLI